MFKRFKFHLRRIWTWRERRAWIAKIEAPCPKGGKHNWDIAAHGPGGSSFECIKCEEMYP